MTFWKIFILETKLQKTRQFAEKIKEIEEERAIAKKLNGSRIKYDKIKNRYNELEDE